MVGSPSLRDTVAHSRRVKPLDLSWIAATMMVWNYFDPEPS